MCVAGGIACAAGANPVPVLMSLSPSSATGGGSEFTLTVTGSDFVDGAVVLWDGFDRLTMFISSIELQAEITASDIVTAGTATVTVFNPAPGGGTSNSQSFSIKAGTDSATDPVSTTDSGGGGGGGCLISAAADGSRLAVEMPAVLLFLGFFTIAVSIVYRCIKNTHFDHFIFLLPDSIFGI